MNQPPQHIEFEENFLSAVIRRSSILLEIKLEIQPEIFYKEQNQEVFRAIADLIAQAKPVDILSIEAQLIRNGKQDIGRDYLFKLTGDYSNASNAEYWIMIVYQKFMLRMAIKIAEETISKANLTTSDPFDVVSKAGSDMANLIEGIVSTNSSRLSDDNEIEKTIKRIQERIEVRKTGKLVGFDLGFNELNNLTGGAKPGNLILLAARPSMGKTAIGLCMMANGTARTRETAGFISIEMTKEAIQDRQMSLSAEVDHSEITGGLVKEYDWGKIEGAINLIKKQNIVLNDSPEMRLSAIRALTRRWVKKDKIKILYLDYIQIVTSSNEDEKKSREAQVSKFARGLKSLAKELNIPIVALAQLSRKGDDRGSKVPILSDLRESGALEQEADLVMFLHRPEYYGEKQFADGTSTEGVAQVIIAKQRNGPVGEIVLKFLHRFTKFVEPDPAPVFAPSQKNDDYFNQGNL